VERSVLILQGPIIIFRRDNDPPHFGLQDPHHTQ
jgi:hypothetical protein